MLAGSEKLFVARAHDLHRIHAGDQSLMAPQQMRPLPRASDYLLGNVLKIGKRFDVSVGCYGREALIVALHQTVAAKGQGIAAAQLLVYSERAFAQDCVVCLNGRAVVAKFAVEGSAAEHSAFLAELMSDCEFERRVPRVGRRVDSSALPGRDNDVAVGEEHFRCQRHIPRPGARSRPERQIGRAFVAIGSFQRERRPLGLARDELHNSAECVAAVEVRSPASEYLDVGNRGTRNSIPIDPTAKSIHKREAVFEDQCAAGSRSAQTAQRHTLIRSVGRAAIRTPKEREARNLSKHVVDAQRRRRSYVGGVKKNGAAGSLGKPYLGTGRGNGDLFTGGSRLQNKLKAEICGRTGGPGLAKRTESFATDVNRSRRRRNGVKLEMSIGVCFGGCLIRAGLENYRSFDDYGAANVSHCALNVGRLRKQAGKAEGPKQKSHP